MGRNPGKRAKGNHKTVGTLNKGEAMDENAKPKGEMVLRKPHELIPARHNELPPREKRLLARARLSSFIAGDKLLRFAAAHGH
jgi:hypothetical protein